MRQSTRLTLPALALAILACAGCATLTPGQPSAALTKRGAVKALPPIRYNSYCEAQRGIAEHNSRVDTLRAGKDVTYKAPCELEPKPKPAPKASEPIES